MLTPGLLEWWWEKRPAELPQSHFARVLGVVPMLRYAEGRWDTPPVPPLPERGRWGQHTPHLFTDGELEAFFHACDTMHKPVRSRESLLTELEVPVMFRLMYANGLRPNVCRLLPGRSTFFPTSQDTPHRNDWLCRQFNAAWYRNNTARATAYDLRHHYVTANIYSWRGQGIGYGLTDRLLALSKSLGHAGIASTLYYFSLVPAFEGEMADELEAALERLAEDTVI